MHQRYAFALLLVSASLIATNSCRAQGALAPTSAPAPTMRSLDQIYSEVAKLSPPSPLVLTPVLNSNQLCTIHMSVVAETQGEIRGESTAKGVEDTIALIGYAHEVVSPRDAASGLPTGKRQHKPLRVLKHIDKTTPQLFAVLANNENLTRVVLKFFQVDDGGMPVNYFRIELTDAAVARIANEFPNTETIELVYRRIEWTHVPSGTTSSDDWQTPVQ